MQSFNAAGYFWQVFIEKLRKKYLFRGLYENCLGLYENCLGGGGGGGGEGEEKLKEKLDLSCQLILLQSSSSFDHRGRFFLFQRLN